MKVHLSILFRPSCTRTTESSVLIPENIQHLQLLKECDSDITIFSQNFRTGSGSDVTMVSASSEQEVN